MSAPPSDRRKSTCRNGVAYRSGLTARRAPSRCTQCHTAVRPSSTRRFPTTREFASAPRSPRSAMPICESGSPTRASRSSTNRPTMARISTLGLPPIATGWLRSSMPVLVPAFVLSEANDAGIHARARAADRLEVGFLARDLPQQERVVAVEAGGGDRRGADVARTQRPSCAGDEVGDAVQRLGPLIKMFVSRQHERHLMLHQERLAGAPAPPRPH